MKLVFTASLVDVQLLKGQCEASTVCGRQMGRWQLYSKTERSLCCLLANASWRIKCNYHYKMRNQLSKPIIDYDIQSWAPQVFLRPKSATPQPNFNFLFRNRKSTIGRLKASVRYTKSATTFQDS